MRRKLHEREKFVFSNSSYKGNFPIDREQKSFITASSNLSLIMERLLLVIRGDVRGKRWFQNTLKYLFPSVNIFGFSPKIEIVLKIDEKLAIFWILVKDFHGRRLQAMMRSTGTPTLLIF